MKQKLVQMPVFSHFPVSSQKCASCVFGFRNLSVSITKRRNIGHPSATDPKAHKIAPKSQTIDEQKKIDFCPWSKILITFPPSYKKCCFQGSLKIYKFEIKKGVKNLKSFTTLPPNSFDVFKEQMNQNLLAIFRPFEPFSEP